MFAGQCQDLTITVKAQRVGRGVQVQDRFQWPMTTTTAFVVAAAAAAPVVSTT